MSMLEALGALPLSNMLSYVLLTCAGVSVTWFNLSRVFERRHSSLLYWSYFVIKGFIDAYMWYCISQGMHGRFANSFNDVWANVMAVVSLFVVLYSFKGDYVQVAACAAVSDLEASILVPITQTLGSLLTGNPINLSFIEPFSLRTLVCTVMMLAGAHLLREPLTWTNRYLCRVVLRNRILWGATTLCFIALYANAVYNVANAGLIIPSSFASVLPFIALPLLVVALLLLQRRREVSERERVLASCAALVRSYDRVMREQLEVLDRDRAVLEGHELALRELGSAAGDRTIAVRVADLERSYRMLSAGSFCTQPALDAVLVSCAERLREHGVKPVFTVAGVPAHMTVDAPMTLALLNLALEAAERASSAGGVEVDLRIRGVGDQLFLRLDVPASWGSLSARRFLAPHTHDRAAIVRERRRADRTVVMVVTEGQGI